MEHLQKDSSATNQSAQFPDPFSNQFVVVQRGVFHLGIRSPQGYQPPRWEQSDDGGAIAMGCQSGPQKNAEIMGANDIHSLLENLGKQLGMDYSTNISMEYGEGTITATCTQCGHEIEYFAQGFHVPAFCPNCGRFNTSNEVKNRVD